jgi:hypothetical protein
LKNIYPSSSGHDRGIGAKAMRDIAADGREQADPKFFKILPSPARDNRRQSKEKALDSLGGIEPFQGLVATPKGKNSFPAAPNLFPSS